VEYPGRREELIKKLGNDYLQEIKARPEMTEKDMRIMFSDKAAVIYSKNGGTRGHNGSRERAGREQ